MTGLAWPRRKEGREGLFILVRASFPGCLFTDLGNEVAYSMKMIKIDFDVPTGLSLFFSNTHQAVKRESSFLFMPRGLECWLHVSYFIIRLQLVLGKKTPQQLVQFAITN